MSLCIGLTGGIGSGKSTVLAGFADLGVPVIDADDIVREVQAPGSPTLTAIAEAFGAEVLSDDGALDRAALRRRVFADPAARSRLEALIHPAVRERIAAFYASLDAPYCVVAIPLLFETGPYPIIDRVLVVDCSEATQLRRVMARSGLSEDEVRAVMATQLKRTDRLSRADDVLDNDSDEPIDEELGRLHHWYLAIAAAQQKPANSC